MTLEIKINAYKQKNTQAYIPLAIRVIMSSHCEAPGKLHCRTFCLM